jgi:predicted dehydrogenase
MMIRVGVVGYGHWGPNLARCVAADPDCALTAICDLLAERLVVAEGVHPKIRIEIDWRALAQDPGIDALLLATPPDTHFPLAYAALRAGKHVLVEKPITRTSHEARTLLNEAERRRLVLMADHTYLFSPAMRAIRKLLAGGELGTMRSFESVRTNGDGTVRYVDPLWDLAPHDLSILDHLLDASPCAVSATSLCGDDGNTVDGAHLSVHFPAGLVANIKVSWSGAPRTRCIRIVGTRRTLVFDDLDPAAKIRIFDREGAMSCPPLEHVEPLRNVVGHFAACIRRKTRPLSDGAEGLRVVRLLEAATCSLAAAGTVIPLDANEEVPA